MRAFGFTNGLRRSLQGADTQRDTGGNENRSLESWQMAGDGPGTERGPRGPPRDLTLRGGFAGDQESTMAGEIPAEQNTPLVFPSARGQATGPGFEPMIQDTSPEPGALNSGDNPLPVALTGYMPMWAGGTGHKGALLPPAPQPTGTNSGTVGPSMPATQAGNGNGGHAVPQGHGGHPPPQANPVRGSTGYSGLGKYTDGLGQEINNAEAIRQTLLWQQDVEGEGAKTSTFKAEVGSLLGFQAFLMMREGTAMVTIIHSVAKYFSISSATSRY
jgi:hypothetical protein